MILSRLSFPLNIELVEDEYYGTVSHLLNLSRKAPMLFEKADIEQKRALINLVLSNLQLKGSQLMWELKKPFDTMAFCSENGNWLPIQVTELLQRWRDTKWDK
jgi:hypothetical protein